MSTAGSWADRGMVLADVERVMAVEVTAYSHPWTRGNFIDSLVAGHPAGLREGSDGRLIGYWVAMAGVDELHLLNLTVSPELQRQGHGRSLLDQVLALARHRGDATLWLEVRRHNRAGRALYNAAGFEEVGVRPGYYPAVKGREDAVVMRLDVPQDLRLGHGADSGPAAVVGTPGLSGEGAAP